MSVFFVTKKRGKLRMIIHCHPSNKRFKRAPRTVLVVPGPVLRLNTGEHEHSTHPHAHQKDQISGL